MACGSIFDTHGFGDVGFVQLKFLNIWGTIKGRGY